MFCRKNINVFDYRVLPGAPHRASAPPFFFSLSSLCHSDFRSSSELELRHHFQMGKRSQPAASPVSHGCHGVCQGPSSPSTSQPRVHHTRPYKNMGTAILGQSHLTQSRSASSIPETARWETCAIFLDVNCKGQVCPASRRRYLWLRCHSQIPQILSEPFSISRKCHFGGDEWLRLLTSWTPGNL